jgi:hypothetical protein
MYVANSSEIDYSYRASLSRVFVAQTAIDMLADSSRTRASTVGYARPRLGVCAQKTLLPLDERR